MFRRMADYVSQLVSLKFPSSKSSQSSLEPRLIAVSGLLILRIICPAIISPETSGIDLQGNLEISKEAKRFLILIAKNVQTLANGSTSNVKESFMDCFSDLIKKYQPYLYNYCERVIVLPDFEVQTEDIGRKDPSSPLNEVHWVINNNLSLFKNDLEKIQFPKENGINFL